MTLETLEHGVLRVATFAGFAPFAWREAGRARGRDLAFLNRFARQHRLQLQTSFFDFSDLWKQPDAGRADIAAAGLSNDQSRGRRAHWSDPYAEVRRSVILRAGEAGRRNGPDDFDGAHLAVVPGSAAETHARQHFPQSLRLTGCATLQEGLTLLRAGRVDGVGTGSLSAEHHAARHPDLTWIDVHADSPREPIAFATRPSGGLPEALNEFIASQAHSY